MIDALQRHMRQDRMGGSDAAAACGLDPWRTPYDLWAEKTGRTPGFTGNAATRAGTYLERGLIDYLADTLDAPVQRDVMVLHDDGVRSVNLDGYLPFAPEPAIAEAKTAGIAGRGLAVGWGDPEDGDEGVPAHVLIQVHHAFGVIENGAVELAHVIACIGGRGICHYRVRRNPALVAAVAERVLAFAELYVRADTPPEGSGPSLDLARTMARVPNKTVSLPTDVVARWVDAKARASAAEKDEKAARSEVFAALGDAEAGTFDGDGQQLVAGTITYFGSERAGFTVAPTTVRTLRIKHDKGTAGVRRA